MLLNPNSKAAILYSDNDDEFNTKNIHINLEKAHNNIAPVGHGNEAELELIDNVQDHNEFKYIQTSRSEISDKLLIAAEKFKTRTARQRIHSKVWGEMNAVYRRFALVKANCHKTPPGTCITV